MTGVLRSAWQGFSRRRALASLTAGSIAIGTAMVVLISGIGKVGGAAIDRELESMGIHGLSVSASAGLTAPCLTSIRALPEVTDAMPLTVRTARAEFGPGDYKVVGCGIDAGAEQVISLEVLHGRLFTDGDVAGAAAVCVVDESLAKEAYGRENVLGKTLMFDCGFSRQELTVVGVTAAGSSLLQNVTAMIPYMLYLPYTTLQDMTGVATFDQIAVRVSPDTPDGQAEKNIRRTLSRSGEDIGTLMTEDLTVQRKRLDSLVGIITVALTAIGGVSLLVSGFGILTVMLSAVHERTREIGIKKAVGATRGRILAEFLTGAVLISAIGAAAGIGIGVAAVAVGCSVTGQTPVWDVTAWIAVFLLTVGLGALFGAYPAYRAAGLRPVEALHREEG